MSAYKPPQRPIRLGLIGCGGIVKGTHLPCYKALGDLVQVVAVADLVPANRDEVGDALGVPPGQRYGHHSDLLEKAQVDAVTIATPHSAHAAQVTEAAQAGVAIISEKPMAATMQEALAMREAVQRHRVPYAVVHNLLHTVPMQAAQAILRAGELGEPYYGRGMSLFHKGDRSTQTTANWRNTRSAGGGAVADTAYHEIYSTEALMGSPVRYVEARVKNLFYAIEVDDMALLLLEHENGALSTVSTSWCVPTVAAESGRWCEVHAPRGSLRAIHKPEGPLLRFVAGEGWKSVDLPGLASQGVNTPRHAGQGHLGFFRSVFEALASGTQTPTTIDTACHTLAIVEAARRASEERRAVDVRELEVRG